MNTSNTLETKHAAYLQAYQELSTLGTPNSATSPDYLNLPHVSAYHFENMQAVSVVRKKHFPKSSWYDTLHLLVKREDQSVERHDIPLCDIKYFDVRGERTTTTHISGGETTGGDYSLKKSVLGYAIAGPLGALVAGKNKVKTTPLVAKEDVVDTREIVLVFVQNQQTTQLTLPYFALTLLRSHCMERDQSMAGFVDYETLQAKLKQEASVQERTKADNAIKDRHYQELLATLHTTTLSLLSSTAFTSTQDLQARLLAEAPVNLEETLALVGRTFPQVVSILLSRLEHKHEIIYQDDTKSALRLASATAHATTALPAQTMQPECDEANVIHVLQAQNSWTTVLALAQIEPLKSTMSARGINAILQSLIKQNKVESKVETTTSFRWIGK